RLEKGFSQPAMLGEKPPVTIKPTPPRARAAKYSASLPKSRAWSSSPVCIEPISTRFGNVQKPRSSGASRCGKAGRSGLADEVIAASMPSRCDAGKCALSWRGRVRRGAGRKGKWHDTFAGVVAGRAGGLVDRDSLGIAGSSTVPAGRPAKARETFRPAAFAGRKVRRHGREHAGLEDRQARHRDRYRRCGERRETHLHA